MESFTIMHRCLLLGLLVVCCSPSQAAGWRHRLRRFNTPTFYDDSPFGLTSLWDDGGSVFDHHASVFDHRWIDSPFIMRPFAFHHNSYPWHCSDPHRTPVISSSRCDHSNVLPEGSQNTNDVPSDTMSSSKQSMNGSPEPPTTTQQRFPSRDNIFYEPADQYHDQVVGTDQLGNHDGPIRQKEPLVDQHHHNTEDSPNNGDPRSRRHHTEKFVDPRLEAKRMDNLRNQQRQHQQWRERHESDNPAHPDMELKQHVDESNMRSQRNRQADQLITSLKVDGYKARHISVNVEGNQIIVKGKLDCSCQADCVESSFERRYNIPHYIDEQSISARLDNAGVLQISGKRKSSNNRPQTGTFQVNVQGDGDSETETIHCRSKTEAKRPGIQLAKFNRKTGKVTLIKETPRSSGRGYPQHVDNDDDASIEVVE